MLSLSHPITIALPKRRMRSRLRIGRKQWLLLLLMFSGVLASVTNVGQTLLKTQFDARRNHRCYVGAILVGATTGCHVGKHTAVTMQYHPNNDFSTGDSIGLGFGEPDFIYGQQGIEAYRNLDKHTFVLNGRVYVLGPFYFALGVAHQRDSTRWITFRPDDRMIGNTIYDDVSISVETHLKDQTAPVLAVGVHPMLQRLGFMAEVNFGLAFSKQLDEAIVTADRPISDADMTLFRETIRQDAESEGFGIATFGPTLSLSPFGTR